MGGAKLLPRNPNSPPALLGGSSEAGAVGPSNVASEPTTGKTENQTAFMTASRADPSPSELQGGDDSNWCVPHLNCDSGGPLTKWHNSGPLPADSHSQTSTADSKPDAPSPPLIPPRVKDDAEEDPNPELGAYISPGTGTNGVEIDNPEDYNLQDREAWTGSG